MGGSRARTIAVANEKGGVGKTVTVINLGAALSKMGKRVLIVDMDPQSSATKGLGEDGETKGLTTYEIIKNRRVPNPVDAVVPTRWEGLDLIPASSDLAGADIELVNVLGRENRLKKGLSGLSDLYDVILLDTPPSLSLLTVNVFSYAGEVLVPCQTHPYAYDALEELFDTIAAVKDEINPILRVNGILATMFDSRTRVSHKVLERLKEETKYRGLLYDTVIRVNTVIAESADAGTPVVFFRQNSYGAEDYGRLAEEITAKADRA